jgi:hypothetical protein
LRDRLWQVALKKGTRQASDSDSVKISDISVHMDTAWAGVTTFRY